MITGLLLKIAFGFINFVLGLLPQTGFSSDIVNGMTAFFNNAWSYNSIFPVDTMFNLLIASGVFWVFVFVWETSKWFIHFIRGN